MTFRDWFDYSIENRCSKCKQIMKPIYQGLIPMTTYSHSLECPMRLAPNIQSCKHCGKDL